MATKRAKADQRVSTQKPLQVTRGNTSTSARGITVSLGKPSKDTPTNFTQITRRNASEDAKTQGTKPTRKPVSYTQTSKKSVAKSTSKKLVTTSTSKKSVAKPTSSVKKPASYTQTSKPTGKSKIITNGRSR